MIKNMKKTIKKDEEIEVVREICPKCQGSGLRNPDYTNSPQCEKCVGHGFINLEK